MKSFCSYCFLHEKKPLLSTLLDSVMRCCEGADQTHVTSCNIQNLATKNWSFFKLNPTLTTNMWKSYAQHLENQISNILQHVAIRCYRAAKRVHAYASQAHVLRRGKYYFRTRKHLLMKALGLYHRMLGYARNRWEFELAKYSETWTFYT